MFRFASLMAVVFALLVCFAEPAEAQVVRSRTVVRNGVAFAPLRSLAVAPFRRQNVVVNNFGVQAVPSFHQQSFGVQFVQPQFVQPQVFVGQSFGGFGSVRVQSFGGCRGF